MSKQKICLLNCFHSQFHVWCLCWSGHCILCFLLWKKKQTIITEIDLVIRNYESRAESDFDKFLHSEKKTQKMKYQWYEHEMVQA